MSAPSWSQKKCHRSFGWTTAAQPGLVQGAAVMQSGPMPHAIPCLGPQCMIFVPTSAPTEAGPPEGACADLIAAESAHMLATATQRIADQGDADLDDEDGDTDDDGADDAG